MMRSGIAAVCLLSCACGDDPAPFIDAAPDVDEPDATPCPKLWTMTTDGGGTALVTGGVVILSQPNIADDSALELTQTGLTGDFDASFQFNAFTPGGTGAFLQAAISVDEATPPRKLTAAIGTFPTVGVSAADQPGGLTDVQAGTDDGGSLRFVRVGDQVTITAMVSDATATVTATYAEQPLRIGLQLGSNMGPIAAPTGVSIGAFTLTGAGVTADEFDCDSID